MVSKKEKELEYQSIVNVAKSNMNENDDVYGKYLNNHEKNEVIKASSANAMFQIDKIESEEIQGYYVDILIKKTIQLENYIIEQIKKDDLEKELLVLEQHSSLKTIIKYNKICLKLLDKLANKEGLSIDKVINKIYEDALEKSLSNYNDSRLISENILYNSMTSFFIT